MRQLQLDIQNVRYDVFFLICCYSEVYHFAEAANQDAAAKQQIEAATAAMAALTGPSGRRRRKPNKGLEEGDAGGAVISSTEKKPRQRQRKPRGGAEVADGVHDETAADPEVREQGEGGVADDRKRSNAPSARGGRIKGGLKSATDGHSDLGQQESNAAAAAAERALVGGRGAGPAASQARGRGRGGGSAVSFVSCPVCSSHFYSAAVLRQHVAAEHPGQPLHDQAFPRAAFSASVRKGPKGAGPPPAAISQQSNLPARLDSPGLLAPAGYRQPSQSWADMDDS